MSEKQKTPAAKPEAKKSPEKKPASKPPTNPFVTQHPRAAGRVSATNTTPRGSR